MPPRHLLHVPHGTFLFPTLLCLFCSPFLAQAEQGAPVLLTMASDNAEAKQEIQLAIRDLLMGWDEMARHHFRQAVTADKESALAWCGLMLTEGVTTESHNALEQILSDNSPLTPQEGELLTTWLQWLQGDRSGAGELFAKQAEQFRNDVLSACWAIVLLHDGYEEVGGKALPNQQRALDIAQQLYERKSQNPLVSYLRAWVEDSAPQPSEEALSAAQHAAETLAEHPAAQLLYGHLLFRKGSWKEALTHIQKAANLAAEARTNVPCGTMEQGEMYPLELRAKLYESTLLWLNGQNRESLLLQSELLKKAHSLTSEAALEPGSVLLHWEAQTLPLRLLMLCPKLPSDAQIAAAVKAVKQAAKDPVLELRDCLRFCLVARKRAAAGKRAEALRCIQSAEACMARLSSAREQCAGQGVHVLSAWTRAHEACRLAVLAAKAAAYPDTADIWLQSLESEQKPATLLMPPVLPHMRK